MNLTELNKITSKSKKRLGRGHGSGRGKTSGRGTKGQLARNDSQLDFDGDANPLIRRLPFLRGRGRNRSLKQKAIVFNLDSLNVFPDGSSVDIENLKKYKLLKAYKNDSEIRVKILGEGDVKKALTIRVPISKSAAQKVEKAGGKIEFLS